MPLARVVVLAAAATLAPVALSPQAQALVARAAAAEPDYDGLINRHAPAIVTVKFVLQMSLGGMEDREQETEAFGVLIDPTGLVLVSNTQMGGFVSLMGRRRGMEVDVKPSKIKVLVGEDTVGVDATLIARDSDLDLAWIRLSKPAEKPLPVLDFAGSTEPKIGDRLFLLAREGRFFDRVPSITQFRVAAVAHKPRALILPGAQSLGMPVFDDAGKIVGVTVLQLAGEEESGGEGIFGGGSGGPAILPAGEVVSATKRALETAEHGGDAAKTEAEPAKKDGSKE